MMDMRFAASDKKNLAGEGQTCDVFHCSSSYLQSTYLCFVRLPALLHPQCW